MPLSLRPLVYGMLCALVFVAPAAAQAQLAQTEYTGAAAIGLALRQLGTTKRVLMIAAHPDDEDTQLLSLLALAQGADVAYLSLTRGEGGQNSIGNELGEALGVLRTEELLAARRLDGAHQFFTRAYDFGFSKSADETFEHWPRDSVLYDVVAIVRRFRPDIIVSVFTGTPRDGHGHHQAAGILAREAFTAAADPKRFPNQLRQGLSVHRTAKLYQSTAYRGDPSLRLPTGEVDPLLGRSYFQIAMASRSRHRSQDMGRLQSSGPRETSVQLLSPQIMVDTSLFTGVDTTLTMWARSESEPQSVRNALRQYDSLVAAARTRFNAYQPNAILPLLAQAHTLLSATRARGDELRARIADEIAELEHAVTTAAQLKLELLTSVPYALPGASLTLQASLWNAGAQPVQLDELRLLVPDDWRVKDSDGSYRAVNPGALLNDTLRVHLPGDTEITEPYFLKQARRGDMYVWPGAAAFAGQPFQPAPVRVAARIRVAGVPIVLEQEAVYRYVDVRTGELRRPLYVVPAYTLAVAPSRAVISNAATAIAASASPKAPASAAVHVTSNIGAGTIEVVPRAAGWLPGPAREALRFGRAGETRTANFELAPGQAGIGEYAVAFAAVDSARRHYERSAQLIDYAHIRPRLIYAPARLQVSAFDVKLPRALRVGYVVGVDPQIPDALEQLGFVVERLDEAVLASGDLKRFDALVVGSRAYEVRPDLIASNARVLDYAQRGGNVVVLYQQYEYIQGRYAPYPLLIGRPHDRIAVEDSPVRIVAPDHRALRVPNVISRRDFEGWVQERSLYMPRTWDNAYSALLEMNDPGEAPQRGAIITARYGRGHYTYTGLAFFRQLPAGVSGAYRLFVNLLSLGVDDAAF